MLNYMIFFETAFKAIILGIVEGLTEFIPVSSTAHLVLLAQVIDFQQNNSAVFEIAIQIGAILAVIVNYFAKISKIIINPLSEKRLIINVLLAFLPAVVIGFFAHDFIKQYLFNNIVIATALIIGGLLIIVIEKKQSCQTYSDINKITALKIGFLQCLAMIPGVSRSAATILGGMLCKLDRKTATEFSFFLAIPTISAACCYDLYKNLASLSFADLQLIAIGAISAFVSSLLVIRWLLVFIANHNFILFGYYRIIIGIIILYVCY
jgi:undecaprenyl-diphosphatase